MPPLRSTAVIASIGAIAVTAGVAVAQDTGGEAAKDPSAIIADAARDTAKVKSYHLTGTIVDESGRTKVAADVFASGNGRLTIDGGHDGKARLVALPGKVYINADAAFWRLAGGKKLKASLVRRLANRWIVQPADDGGAATSLLSEFRPKVLAKCLGGGGTGTLTKSGTATIGGQPAIVLKDAGDKPGTSPGRYYVTAQAPVLLLRATQTGPAKAGKAKNAACGDDDGDSTTGSDLRLSRFDKVAKVTAPRGAVTPEQAARGGAGDAPTTPS
jgi:hypothetical protein